MNSALYDKLKFVAQIGLPAAGTLYFTLAGIWGLPAAEEVVGTVVAIDTFLGVTLQLSSAKYDAKTGSGTLEVFDNADRSGKGYSLVFDGDPVDEIEGKDRVVFEVQKQ